MKREDYLKLLRENENLKEIFSKSDDQKEKRAIKAYTEDFALKFYDNLLSPIMLILEKDPEALNKALTEIENELISKDQEKK